MLPHIMLSEENVSFLGFQIKDRRSAMHRLRRERRLDYSLKCPSHLELHARP